MNKLFTVSILSAAFLLVACGGANQATAPVETVEPEAVVYEADYDAGYYYDAEEVVGDEGMDEVEATEEAVAEEAAE